MTWDDHKVQILRDLAAAGLSASQISRRIVGTTRCAVFGKATRLGIQIGGKRASPPRKITVKPAPKYNVPAKLARVAARISPSPPPPIQPAGPNAVDILTIAARGQCRYPVAEQPFLFCGDPTDGEHQYCKPHRRRCCTPIPPNRARIRAWA